MGLGIARGSLVRGLLSAKSDSIGGAPFGRRRKWWWWWCLCRRVCDDAGVKESTRLRGLVLLMLMLLLLLLLHRLARDD